LTTLECRLDALKRKGKYLVWYHHLHTTKDLLAKQAAKDARDT
jgi:hypothetical protein